MKTATVMPAIDTYNVVRLSSRAGDDSIASAILAIITTKRFRASRSQNEI
jgi:ribose 5-phosphate isomerase RpiB